MSETSNTQTQYGLSELEKIFQEYKSKLESAEREANNIVNAAWEKAETIIAEKQNEASRTADGIIQKATREAETIIAEAGNRAAEIEKEAAEKAKKDAKNKLRNEVEKLTSETRQKAEKEASSIINNAREKAEQIVGQAEESTRRNLVEKSESIIAEAKSKAVEVEEESVERAEIASELITEVSQRAYNVLTHFQKHVQGELDNMVIKLDNTMNDLKIRGVLKDAAISNAESADGNYILAKGQQKLNILQPYDRRQITRLAEILKNLPGVSLKGEVGTEDSFSINIDVAEPVPLNRIMEELSMVESYENQDNCFKIKLKHLGSEISIA